MGLLLLGSMAAAQPQNDAQPQLAVPAWAGDAGPEGLSPDSLQGHLDRATKRLARQKNDEALALLGTKDFPAALRRLEDAHALAPQDAEISNNLGYLYSLLGDRVRAEKQLRHTLSIAPERVAALTNLADLLAHAGASATQLQEAVDLVQRARQIEGNDPTLILRQARIEAKRARFQVSERLYKQLLSAQPLDDPLRLELGDFYRDWGRYDEALKWYRRVARGGRLRSQATRRIFELEVAREARRYGWAREDARVSVRARKLVERAQQLLNQQRYAEARRLLQQALALSPLHARAHAGLGDVARRRGDRSGAELGYLRALALQPNDANTLVRLAELLAESPRNKRTAEIAAYLQRAAELRPDWVEVRLTLAQALRAAGDPRGALNQVRRYLAKSTGSERKEAALALQEELQRALRDRPRGEGTGQGEGTTSRSLVTRLSRARAYLVKGEPDAAMAELRRLPREERASAEVLGLQARILEATGRLTQAAKVLRRSLSVHPDRAESHEQLALLLSALDDETGARAALVRAEELGLSAATYHLARLDLAPILSNPLAALLHVPSLLRARRGLARYVSRADSSSVYLEEARALSQKVRMYLRWVVALFVGLAVGLLVLILWAWMRARGGADLRRLAAGHPEVVPELQNVLAAIRHEVLKHNTMMLQGLIEGLRSGELVGDQAAHLQRSLLGGDEAEQGAAEVRLEHYLRELRQLGRSHDVRLNLRHRDPALSAIGSGFALLRRSAGDLGRVDQLSKARRALLLRRLTRAAELLNKRGYTALNSLLTDLRSLRVDEALLRAIYRQTVGEPAFTEAGIAPVVLDSHIDLPVAVVITRRALEDILTNLLRNAVQACLEDGDSMVVVGLGVDAEVDPITGFEFIVLAVRDRSPRVLTTEMLRSGPVEQGLGLVADLVGRHGGTLEVHPGPAGWNKSVCIRLPRATATQA